MTDPAMRLERSMTPRPQKFAQATVETCAYRRAAAATDEFAWCGLLQQISGVSEPQRCFVPRNACSACCQSFPPTIELWNPVIASLLLNVLDQIVKEGGLPECSVERASQLQQKGLASLDVARSADEILKPLRVDRPCCFLGPMQPQRSGVLATDATFDCGHPSHVTTTEEQCRRCRDWSVLPTVSRTLTPKEMVPFNVARTGPQVRRWSVGVVTAPRREATLEWCLESVVRAGWDRPHLFIDGLIRIPDRYLHLPVTWREQSVGAWPNTYLALMEMIQRDPHADAFLLLQDDAFLYDRNNLREYLEEALWPGGCPSVVSLFCPQPYNKSEPGWHTRAEPWVWGAQAFVFSRAAALEFVRAPEVFSHRWTGHHEGRVQVDVLIGQWATDHDWPVWFPNPSLAQHVGNTSSIWRDARIAGWRRADWFAGDLESPFSHESAWANFPEDHFPCRAEFRAEYERRNEIGRERMSQRRVVICGLCRNVRHFLPKFVAGVERLGAMFRDYRVVLFENDSTDATLEFLQDWRKLNDRVQVLSEQLGAIHYPSIRSADRATRLAEYRNRCRRFTLEHFGDFENAIVIDTDLAGGWSNDGIANTFGHDDWDFVGSYGLLQIHSDRTSDWLQYDAWAFRAIGHPHPHSNVEVNSMIVDRGEPLLPVLSCFGGLGVYRMDAIKAAEYDGPDCEHVVLHERMRKQGCGRLFLNPSQIVLYSPR